MFGSKKIFAKIIQSKLVVRVGGGHMDIDEFIEKHGLVEVSRLKRLSKEQIAELHTPVTQHSPFALGSSKSDKVTVLMQQKLREKSVMAVDVSMQRQMQREGHKGDGYDLTPEKTVQFVKIQTN